MSWLTGDELETMGFASVGKNVLISDKASLYNCQKISIGSNVRIDDFAVLSAGEGGIFIGDHVHIAVFCCLMGKAPIILHDFSGLSSRVSVYSSTGDYSGVWMTNPTVPPEYSVTTDKEVTVGRHAVVGSGCVLLPGVTLGEGAAIGALSLVTTACRDFGFYFGTPAKFMKWRGREFLLLEEKVRNPPRSTMES